MQVDANGNYIVWPELAWNGSGGGVSVIFALPKFENNVPNIITTGNNIPDVSFDANPGSGAALPLKGNWSVSLIPAVPDVDVSIVVGSSERRSTEIDQVKSARHGQANKKIYQILEEERLRYQQGKKLYFHDVITVGQ